MTFKERASTKVLLTALINLLTATNLFAQGSQRGDAQPALHKADFSVFSKDETMNIFLLCKDSPLALRVNR